MLKNEGQGARTKRGGNIGIRIINNKEKDKKTITKTRKDESTKEEKENFSPVPQGGPRATEKTKVFAQNEDRSREAKRQASLSFAAEPALRSMLSH
jgi:hypothetical protein